MSIIVIIYLFEKYCETLCETLCEILSEGLSERLPERLPERCERLTCERTREAKNPSHMSDNARLAYDDQPRQPLATTTQRRQLIHV